MELLDKEGRGRVRLHAQYGSIIVLFFDPDGELVETMVAEGTTPDLRPVLQAMVDVQNLALIQPDQLELFPILPLQHRRN